MRRNVFRAMVTAAVEWRTQDHGRADDQQGSRRRRGWPWSIAGGVVGLAVAAAVTWWSFRYEAQRITGSTFAFQVLSDTSIQVTFDVSRPPGLAVTCTIRALDLSFTVVGTTDVVVPREGGRDVRLSHAVRTTTRAVSGQVHDCVRT